MGARIGISSHRRIGFLYFFRAEFQGEKNGFQTHKEEITKAGLSFDRQYRQSSTERGEQARDKIVPQFVQCTVLFGKPREDIHFGRRQIQTLPARFGDCPRVYQYYIFEDDKLGNRVKEVLLRCARRGIQIRILYDDVGCWSVKKRFFKEMQDAGIAVRPFLEITFPQLASRINYRNHRKITVIDGKIGYIGGMNIADRYVEGTKWGTWRDTHLRIEGPAVRGLQLLFAVDWSYECKEVLSDSRFFPPVADKGKSGIQIAPGGPIGEWSNIAMLFLKAITNAKKNVYIQTPYFLPTESLVKALQTAALAKVDVRLMIPERSDSTVLRFASFSYITEMLRAGVKVYFYQPGILHSKTIIIDDELCSVGSTNFDFRSFEHNFEANAFIYDREVNSEMKRIFLEDQQQCRRIIQHYWRHRPLYQKGIESIMRLLSPVL